MEENKNSVPEQSEPEQVTEAQEQQTAAEQESQSPEQVENAPEQIDYKSELEKANSRIAELEMNADISELKVKYKFSDDNSAEVVTKARELVSSGFAENITEAAGMLAAKMPDIICANRPITTGFATSNNSIKMDPDIDFERGLNNNKPFVKGD